ncbi:MAG: hypothetical protein J6Y20_05355 [Lachnospiraceae bacterium]|nr:hypothetical protein [Lachnospiraceae bacterium]
MSEEYYYTAISGNRYMLGKDTELRHWGVNGMKWGIRKYQNEDGSYKPGAEGRYYHPNENKRSKSVSEDYEKSRSKSRQEMSDDELRTAVNRLNNERQYEQYRKELKKSDEENDSLKKEEKKRKESEEHKISTKFKSEQLSDEELDKAIERLNKEKQYRQLVEESKSPMNRAFSKAAKTFASTMFNTAMSEINKGIKEKMSLENHVAESKRSSESARKMANIGLEQLRRQRERLKG